MHPVAQDIADLLADHDGYFETPKNLTMFAKELDSVEAPKIPRQGSPWCGTFVDWGFYKADALGALVFRTFGTSVAAQRYIAENRWFSKPQPGDLAFLKTSGPGHVGFVLELTSDGRPRTIEGNTSSVGGDDRNGGEVAIKTHGVGYWAGFGRPNYDSVQQSSGDLAAIGRLVTGFRRETLRFGMADLAVTFWQRLLNVADTGTFDSATVAATKAFQQSFRTRQQTEFSVPADSVFLLPVTGVVDNHTWAAKLDYP